MIKGNGFAKKYILCHKRIYSYLIDSQKSNIGPHFLYSFQTDCMVLTLQMYSIFIRVRAIYSELDLVSSS